MPGSDQTTYQFEDKIEEFRTICRLHAYHTGHWEDLLDLPFRLSQDTGLRSDLMEIVRSLQRANFNLPDVLDMLVVAVGGSDAPRHTRELTEPLNLLGSFLLSVGRWPSTDTSPILAPGEVPENIERFTRPQPRAPQTPPPVPVPPAPATPAAGRSVRLFEARPRRAESAPNSQPTPPPPDQRRSAQPESTRNPAAPPATPPSRAPSPLPASTRPPQAPELGTPAPGTPRPDSPDRRSSPQSANVPDRQIPDREITDRPGTPDRLGSDRPGTPDRSVAPIAPPGDLGEVLARLERGNFELRAHLDSIDQRISRMEPLLESDASPEDPTPSIDPVPPTPAAPVLLGEPPLNQRSPKAWPSTAPSAPDSVRSAPVRANPNRAGEDLTSGPLRLRPDPAAPSAPARPLPDRPSRNQQESAAPSGTGTPATPPTIRQNLHSPSPSTPRFSRFARDPVPVDTDPAPSRPASDQIRDRIRQRNHDLVPDELPNQLPNQMPDRAPHPVRTREEDLDPDADPDDLRPMSLPRGFFGTVPEPHPSDLVTDPAPGHLTDQPVVRRPRYALIGAALVLIALLVIAAILYGRSGDATPNSAPITAAPAPRTSASGPVSNTPQRGSAARRTGAPDSILPASNASPSRPPVDNLGSVNGFHPAGTFVPAAVMEAHLVSAPPPDRSRIPASTGAQNIVVMDVNVSPTGQVEDINVLGGNRDLRPAAISAVRNWRYRPYLLNGAPVEVRTVVRLDFNQRR